MSRVARDSSWHLFAFVIVIAGLGVLAPLAWWQAREPRLIQSSRSRHLPHYHIQDDVQHEPADETFELALLHTVQVSATHAIDDENSWEPQVAPLAPLVADQIDLDPSVTESPALPIARATVSDDPLLLEATGDLRLSATLARPSQPELPQPKENLTPLRQPSELPDASRFTQPVSPVENPAWPYPLALVEQLRTLANTTPAAANWAEQAIRELVQITQSASLADPGIESPLASLRRLADEAKPLAQTLRDNQDRSRILRAGYAIVRRLVIWDQVHTLAASNQSAAAPTLNARAWHETLEKVDSLLGATGGAANWRKYLLLDRALRDFDSTECSPVEQRQLARDILHRLHSTQLSHEQEKFLRTLPFEALDEHFHARAEVAPDLVGLLRAIERYEHEDHSASAQALAREYDLLRWSSHHKLSELAQTVNAYYRNANVRVALSSELVNRMLPQMNAQVEAVEDTILGAWVSGQSQTNTKVRLALIPDEHRWNIGLEALGEVASDTASSKGPATFYQNGWSMFRARKRLTVDRRGIRLFNAEAEANTNNDLNDFETDFDGIPLVGSLVRAIARRQYDTSQPAAKVEVEGKIIVRATSQLDREVAQKLEQAKQDFQVKMIKPLRDLNLEPTAVDLGTTADRLIARYRIAARDDLSAHTPRPQAPGDSMLSVQIHESALNNVLEALNLPGRRVELTDLYQEMTTRFSQTRPVEIPEDLPENVFVTFSEEDPVRVDCEDGRVRLTIRLRELVQTGTRNRWTNFTVQAYYEPSADQLDANLRRVGIIELIGDNRPLPVGQRVALSGIFNRVLSKSRKLEIINKQISESPQLRDQQVTQFVIHDGWIGVALGPQAPGREAAMHPRQALERE
jgi:hypothetical protein